jgi:hypothetical protein
MTAGGRYAALVRRDVLTGSDSVEPALLVA